MRGMLTPLSPHEETALRHIGFGTGQTLDPSHVRRLLQLDLIEWDGRTWRLTDLGRRRHDGLGGPSGVPAKPNRPGETAHDRGST